jgi:hypothetical protein
MLPERLGSSITLDATVDLDLKSNVRGVLTCTISFHSYTAQKFSMPIPVLL